MDGLTNRQAIEDLTQTDDLCASCHAAIINPYGFPFESFDAAGQFRTTDNDLPVDTSAEPLVEGAATPVADALELIDLLATNRRVHECYAQHVVEFMLGRHEAGDRDAAWVDRLGGLSSGGASIRDVIVALVTSPSFLTRSADELPAMEAP